MPGHLFGTLLKTVFSLSSPSGHARPFRTLEKTSLIPLTFEHSKEQQTVDNKPWKTVCLQPAPQISVIRYRLHAFLYVEGKRVRRCGKPPSTPHCWIVSSVINVNGHPHPGGPTFLWAKNRPRIFFYVYPKMGCKSTVGAFGCTVWAVGLEKAGRSNSTNHNSGQKINLFTGPFLSAEPCRLSLASHSTQNRGIACWIMRLSKRNLFYVLSVQF